MKMFQKIQELVDDSDALVCLLIDEVIYPLKSHPINIDHIMLKLKIVI